MIGKIFPKSSGTFKKRIRYVFGCTKHDHEISHIVTIDSNCISPDPLPEIQAGSEADILEMIAEFDQVETLRRMSTDSDKSIKPVFHAMLSLLPGESLTTQQWRKAVRKYMADLGFTENNKYVAVMHRDKDHEHVHIVANRISLDEGFLMIKDSNERIKSMDSASEIENMYDLNKAPRPTETWGVAITHAEMQASVKAGELPHKHKLIAKIASAIEHTNTVQGDMFDFVKLLRHQKVYINLTLDCGGQPKGISYEFDGKHISGRQLKRSRLTWQKLINQEGISYDPQTIRELQGEIARRDSDEHRGAERLRYYYFVFRSGPRRVPIRMQSNNWRLDRDVRKLLEALEVLFGIKLLWDRYEAKPNKYFVEFIPGKPLKLPASKIVDTPEFAM